MSLIPGLEPKALGKLITEEHDSLKQQAEDSIVKCTYNGKTGVKTYYDKDDNLVKETYDTDRNGIDEYSVFNCGKNQEEINYYNNKTGKIENTLVYENDELLYALDYDNHGKKHCSFYSDAFKTLQEEINLVEEQTKKDVEKTSVTFC